MRAAALAASQPAWPPPMTITSKDVHGAFMPIFYLETIAAESQIFASADVSRETASWVRFGPLFHVK
jgi:hypothetical protein